MRNWKVDPNACNPFHICASYCFDYLNEGSERRQLQASQALGDVVVDEEAPGSNGVSFLEDQLNIHDVASASNPNLTAQEDESIDAAVAEELDLEISEEAPDNYGEEMTSFS
ncbi:uncharacterized protein LOC124688895 [Lolium rigidum]|uniref:uncharacterized protein LOC124688895 n=1 Tax=Lolium rigidum TaxID=89674 RepID=UPI001F5DD3F2|nr:uncharacterized protein LOC124688895 [Lolium rigidum]XP_047078467.1 uncharacterized protein LOC124688895 [Lolium rigidum]XP_047078468.1 uncharacterized protein LOC124688895 [Lolium rigidum]XP_047078469.1 uncharacterized protein LOC124688895 [Lolium rigidum]